MGAVLTSARDAEVRAFEQGRRPAAPANAPAKEAQPPPVIIKPLRPGRYEPRVRKRRPPEYPIMTKPRAELRKTLLEKSLAA